MNGRVYDYNLGRFLSVDPFIQSPGNSQSMNPYSYIMNNPLAGTDPSGYLSESSGGCDLICATDGELISGRMFDSFMAENGAEIRQNLADQHNKDNPGANISAEDIDGVEEFHDPITGATGYYGNISVTGGTGNNLMSDISDYLNGFPDFINDSLWDFASEQSQIFASDNEPITQKEQEAFNERLKEAIRVGHFENKRMPTYREAAKLQYMVAKGFVLTVNGNLVSTIKIGTSVMAAPMPLDNLKVLGHITVVDGKIQPDRYDFHSIENRENSLIIGIRNQLNDTAIREQGSFGTPYDIIFDYSEDK